MRRRPSAHRNRLAQAEGAPGCLKPRLPARRNGLAQHATGQDRRAGTEDPPEVEAGLDAQPVGRLAAIIGGRVGNHVGVGPRPERRQEPVCPVLQALLLFLEAGDVGVDPRHPGRHAILPDHPHAPSQPADAAARNRDPEVRFENVVPRQQARLQRLPDTRHVIRKNGLPGFPVPGILFSVRAVPAGPNPCASRGTGWMRRAEGVQDTVHDGKFSSVAATRRIIWRRQHPSFAIN